MSAGNTTARGYGATHQKLRKQWQQIIDRGGVTCWRCGQPINPQRWHLGHDDNDRTQYRGPECVTCNLHAGASKGGKVIAARRRHQTNTVRSRNW